MQNIENATSYIRENYSHMTDYELSEATHVTMSHVYRVKKKYGLVSDSKTSERYERQKRIKRAEGVRRSLAYDRMLVMSGKPPRSRRHISSLSTRARRAGTNLRYRYNYFNLDGVDDVFYFDNETRRTPSESYFSHKYGFRFIEADED